ncbi:MAG: DUF459 domain-containing protein [Brevundimonas sp.]|uniref:SGNH/GDSL hydrolase family protein n=1 Tax=Brevundimonas sp. TaxID=1871086 RepID=UPI002722AC4F|nr:DUF459 domain-containing protein [Brevundimonas sp.]MDO9607119.1 DUF459 domain-containing protein [Brevundimonas sp.]
MRAGINGLTAALVVGVVIGLMLTPDGRGWLRHPTLMLGGSANASASPPAATAPVEAPASAPVAKAMVTPLKARAASGALRIGVIGDSMADGLWTALYRDLNGKDGVTVAKFSEVSTGLSRYDYVDIQAKTARQLRETPVDAAVVMFGTNDAQGISLDGVIHDFGTPGWKAAYAKRIDDLVGLLRANDVAVYWVGLPKMKRAGFDAKMTIINAVARERMTALGVPLIETTGVTADTAGEYAAYLPGANGRPQLMRANDGIHMTMAGYRRIGAPVAERLKRDTGLDAAAAQPQTTG